MISATIVADSKNTFGQRITTMKLVFPRIVLAEFNTHRALSRNSASSRAIPYRRMVKQIQDHPFIPLEFQKPHSGMQGTEYYEGEEHDLRVIRHLSLRDIVIDQVEEMHMHGMTKQLLNRYLEPWCMHTVLVTATEWENFFALRAHPDAEIHIADLAEKMLVAYNESTPKQLQPGEWHIPFGDNMHDGESLFMYGVDLNDGDTKIKIATARCARLSYETLGDDPKIDYAADIRLHDQLLAGGHMSPFEHCARAMSEEEMIQWQMVVPRVENGNVSKYFVDTTDGVCGNFRGFIQYRKMLAGENKSDNRIVQK